MSDMCDFINAKKVSVMKNILVLFTLLLILLSCDIVEKVEQDLKSVYMVEFTAESKADLGELPYNQTLYLSLVDYDKSVRMIAFSNTGDFEEVMNEDLCVTVKGVIDKFSKKVQYESSSSVSSIIVRFYYALKSDAAELDSYPDLNVTMKVYKNKSLVDTQEFVVNDKTIPQLGMMEFIYPCVSK